MDIVGQQVGNYDLLEHLGSGGYADVYRGKHQRFQAEVAIKMLRMSGFSVTQEQDFRKEAQIITALRHPHIIRVLNYDIWQEPTGLQRRIPYIVMTYAPLGSLRKAYLEGKQVPPEKIALYIKQMAEALQEAHNQSVVHCDVKPENMLRISADDLVLTDFGIAKDHHSTVEVPHLPNTQPEAPKVFGTPGYMPPERCIGGPVSRSGDQYALAIVAYEWLTGHRPFEGDTSIEILTKQATLSPPSMRAKFPEISQEVEDVVMRALARESSDRYPTIQEFAQAFEQAIAAQVAASNSGGPQRQARQARVSPPSPPPQQAKQVPASPPSPSPQQARPAQANPASPLPQQTKRAQANPASPPPQQAKRAQANPTSPPPHQVRPAQAGRGAAKQAQGQMVLPGNSPGGYASTTMGNTQPSQPSSQQQQSGSSGFDDFKALWTFNPFRGLKQWWNGIDWLKTDPPAKYSRRPRTMFPLISQFCIVLVTAVLALLTLPYGLIIGLVLELFFYRFLRWALYLVRPGVANFFLSLVSLYYGMGFILLSSKLLPYFSRSLGTQALLVVLPVLVFIFSVMQNRRYVKLMHKQ
ncbi:MAG: serine/threonine protein kinase [Ktedonobacteraceae bacterium]